MRTSAYTRFWKRSLDIVVVLLFSPLWIPVLFTLALVVRIRLGSPIFFRQRRPGHRAQPFTLIKFRTMTDRRGPDGQLLPDVDRLPPFGKWLRSTSLDELPELINILRGEMSLVGPRPLLMQYIERYNERQARRHLVKPGLTGWAQVNGRNAISWDEKFELDVWYADHCSFWLDLRILLLTIIHTVRRSGISTPGSETAFEFLGGTETSNNDELNQKRHR